MGEAVVGSSPATVPFRPGVAEVAEAGKVLRAFATALAALPDNGSTDNRQELIGGALSKCLRARDKWDRAWRVELVAVLHVLADLARLGWRVVVTRANIAVERPRGSRAEDQRERRREQLHSQRDQQLREPSVQAFIRDMETPRAAKSGTASVFSLMRDGRSLAASLTEARGLPETKRVERLQGLIAPYLQFVDDSARCEHTGIKLIEIWRYFRHTWANPYQSVPGRSMGLLVRDSAIPNHPVIGIAAISSSAVQLTSRDRFIGWEADVFVEWATAHPSVRIARWAAEVVDTIIDELYKTDFRADKLLSERQLAAPNHRTIQALEADAAVNRERHKKLMRGGEYKKALPTPDREEEHWEEQARTPLFRAKRAEELSRLFKLRALLREAFGDTPSVARLNRLLSTPSGRAALGSIARKAKARCVGICIADLTVCGAVPPYGSLLGGKLVAMLAASPEVVAEYKRRYGKMASVIASSMAGKRIARPAELVFVGTTSLYGVRPSQYDRISVPCDRIGGRVGEAVRYEFLEHTQGLGTFQFGDPTVSAIEAYLRQSSNGLAVNSVFGEGANPRLRKLRDGLAALGLASEAFLTHGLDKLIYAVPLIRNLREYLLGLDSAPEYRFGRRDPGASTQAIGRWWAERWLVPRIARDEVLAEVAGHTLALPVTHGARVPLPEQFSADTPLFEWS
jgi:hypothetical protein